MTSLALPADSHFSPDESSCCLRTVSQIFGLVTSMPIMYDKQHHDIMSISPQDMTKQYRLVTKQADGSLASRHMRLVAYLIALQCVQLAASHMPG